MTGHFGSFQSDNAIHYTARLHEKFEAFEVQMRGALPDFLSTEYSERCKEALKEVGGMYLPNMFDLVVVKQLVQEVVESIEGPCLQLVSDCFAYAMQVQQAVTSHVCGLYPGLNNVAHLQGTDAMRKAKESAYCYIQGLLTKEKKVIFTLNHYYLDTINVFSYVKVMHKRLCDVISMEIRMCLENVLLGGTDDAIWREINLENNRADITKIVALKGGDQQRRARLEESIERMKAAEATLLSLAFDVPNLLA
ncbi:unnamed protein product [Closterium sp. Yama58-4]|nr:unnamed protein product [Closterium sp. Yama58-4]